MHRHTQQHSTTIRAYDSWKIYGFNWFFLFVCFSVHFCTVLKFFLVVNLIRFRRFTFVSISSGVRGWMFWDLISIATTLVFLTLHPFRMYMNLRTYRCCECVIRRREEHDDECDSIRKKKISSRIFALFCVCSVKHQKYCHSKRFFTKSTQSAGIDLIPTADKTFSNAQMCIEYMF